MPIVVSCPCGRKLKAPDAAAGRRAKCPACGEQVTIPAPAAAPADDTYELADDLSALAPSAPPKPVPVLTTQRPKPATKPDSPAAASTADLQGSQLYQAYASRVAQRDSAAVTGPRPLFNIAGIDVTRTKLAVFLVLVVLLVGGPTWFFTAGPGAHTKLVAAHTVQVTPLLEGLDTREPYSLFTGTGDRSLGLKGPKLKSGVGYAGSDVTYSFGGGDELLLLKPDEQGDHVVAEVQLSHGFIAGSGKSSDYKLHIHDGSFLLEPVDGEGEPIRPRLLYARFEDDTLEIDSTASNVRDYKPLLPAGVPPSHEEIQHLNGGPASGTVTYDGSQGVTGSLTFASSYYLFPFPDSGGVSADGHLTRTLPDGAAVEYDYQGGVVEIKVPKDGVRKAWWAKAAFTQTEDFNPWEKLRVGLLFPRPPGDGAYTIKYENEAILAVNPAKAARASARLAAAPPPTPQPAAASGSEEEEAGEPVEPVTGYLKVLADARDKARGVVGMSNMNQIGIAIGMYVQANGGRMPVSLDVLRSVMPDIDGVLLNPRTKENPGFIYECPAETFDQIQNPHETPILWEAKGGQKDPDGSILYADGHIESKYIP